LLLKITTIPAGNPEIEKNIAENIFRKFSAVISELSRSNLRKVQDLVPWCPGPESGCYIRTTPICQLIRLTI